MASKIFITQAGWMQTKAKVQVLFVEKTTKKTFKTIYLKLRTTFLMCLPERKVFILVTMSHKVEDRAAEELRCKQKVQKFKS